MPVQKILDILTYLPMVAGLPPLKLPEFLSQNYKSLMKAKNIDELETIFKILSHGERKSLAGLVKYQTVKKYYIYLVSTFYFFYTANLIYDVEKQVEHIELMTQFTDESLEDMQKLVDPTSCLALASCLEDFAGEWKGKSKEAYLEVKASCIEVYGIKQGCD